MTVQIAVPEVEIEKIDVVEDFNSRQEMDQDELDRMAATVAASGIVQPVKVRPRDDGRFDLVYGHRRLEAARRAGLEKVPVTPSTGNARVEAFYENNQRSDLNPVERALDLKAFAEELGLSTHKAIAAAAGKKTDWVGAHLRLLKLPDGVRGYVADGTVPLDGERLLRPIAAVSPAVAECVCEVARRNRIKGQAFVARFEELFSAAGEARFKSAPTMIPTRRPRLSAVVTDKKRRSELKERIVAVQHHGDQDDPFLSFAEAEVDAARAAGCLVEHSVERRGFVSTAAFIIDREFAVDLVERMVERIEKEAEKRAEEDAAWRQRQAEARGGSAAPEDQKTKRAKAKEDAAKARTFNEELGRNQLRSRTAARRKQHGSARIKAIATVFVADHPDLAARGLRLTMPTLQEVEVKTLKSGESRTKVSYADREQCTEELLRRIDAAGSEAERLEVVIEALLAAILADDRELPKSKRVSWSPREQAKVEKLLAADIKAVRPRRTKRKEDE